MRSGIRQVHYLNHYTIFTGDTIDTEPIGDNTSCQLMNILYVINVVEWISKEYQSRCNI